MTLTVDSAAQIWDSLEPDAPYNPFKTATQVTKDLTEIVANTNKRLMTGINAIDVMTRGFGPKELIIVGGFAHSGKTQLALTMIVNNLSKNWAIFSLDDPAELLLQKLYCMAYRKNSADFEQQLRDNPDTLKQLEDVAANQFARLNICDETKTVQEMQADVAAMPIAPDAILIDYLQLIPAGEDSLGTVNTRANDLKNWAKQLPSPIILIHQGTRSGSEPGAPFKMTSLAFGGEQQATMILGVRRKKDDYRRDKYNNWLTTPSERERHKNTITVHLVKNKRPPCRLTAPDGLDLWIDDISGKISTSQPSLGDQLTAAMSEVRAHANPLFADAEVVADDDIF